MAKMKKCNSWGCVEGWIWDAGISMYQRCHRCHGYGYKVKV